VIPRPFSILLTALYTTYSSIRGVPPMLFTNASTQSPDLRTSLHTALTECAGHVVPRLGCWRAACPHRLSLESTHLEDEVDHSSRSRLSPTKPHELATSRRDRPRPAARGLGRDYIRRARSVGYTAHVRVAIGARKRRGQPGRAGPDHEEVAWLWGHMSGDDPLTARVRWGSPRYAERQTLAWLTNSWRPRSRRDETRRFKRRIAPPA
jgi:hypothetical protein